MHYIDDGVLGVVFQVVSGNYARTEEVPNFKEDTQGMDKLRGVLSGVQSDHFYPTVLDKAAYIFIQINKGHYFSNGNKRLALVKYCPDFQELKNKVTAMLREITICTW